MNKYKIINKFNTNKYIMIFAILNLSYIALTAYKLNVSTYYMHNNLNLREYFINTKGVSDGILLLDWSILVYFIISIFIFFNPIEKYKKFIKVNSLLFLSLIIISIIISHFTKLGILNFLQQLFIPLFILIASLIIKILKKISLIVLKG